MKKSILTIGLTLSAGLYCVVPAQAGMDLRASFQDAALSIDGWGGTTGGSLQTDIPTGSTVLAAYLYSADVWGQGGGGNVTLDGNFLAQDTGILLPKNNPVNVRLYDVTSYLKSKIEGGMYGLQNWSISEANSPYNDGEVLVVAYKNTNTVGGTAIILDGGLSTGGDTTKLTFASPYTSGDAIMSVASSFSYMTESYHSQFTIIDVATSSNTEKRRLSTATGGNDDGYAGNGGLITVGGIGDSPNNPDDPNGTGLFDDELYNLALGNSLSSTPFLKPGDTWVELYTNNPSNDDNVFFTAFTSTFKITNVDDDDIDDGNNAVPEPTTMLLFGSGLLGLAATGRKRKIK